jgi:hypothetical protein
VIWWQHDKSNSCIQEPKALTKAKYPRKTPKQFGLKPNDSEFASYSETFGNPFQYIK